MKLEVDLVLPKIMHVALRVRARIETAPQKNGEEAECVALRVRARIETFWPSPPGICRVVALRVRARIETRICVFQRFNPRLPSA